MNETLIARGKNSSLSVVNTEKIYVIFKARIGLCAWGPGFAIVVREILYIFLTVYTYILKRRDGEEKIMFPSCSLAKSKCTNFSRRFLYSGMLLPYYKSGCPHMDFLVVDWNIFYISSH